ncbi:LacI family transcriptional regulator [Ruminococcaceae bacterium OttesenSCG-928-A16]|nr:LacI family transcriptional regulator [Ruminococcaceae bacterium OttesenSCG-928-A16]
MSSTIRDVAAFSGVSPSTVSRVINNKGVISQKTQQKIYEAMQKLDYHPNSLAQSFAKGKAGAVLMVMDASYTLEYANTYFLQTMFAMETVFQEHGYSLVISSSREEGENSGILQIVYSKRADGLILPPATVNAKLLDSLEKAKIPFVVLGQPELGHQPYSWVDIDNAMGASQAVDHLIEQGYSRIAMVAGDQKAVFMQKRLAGYYEALERHELEQHKNFVIEYSDDTDAYRAEIAHLLANKRAPDAFICGDNVMAFHTLQAVKASGRRIPQDIGILTFDNYPLAEYTEPPLTAVEVDTFLMGQHAARILMDQISKSGSGEVVSLLPTSLNVRESTIKRG